MANHLEGTNSIPFQDHHHVFLIRDPRKVIRSFRAHVDQPTAMDLCYNHQWEWLQKCCENSWPYMVVDSDDLVVNPETNLRRICTFLKVPFEQEMLSWKPGPRPEDGAWAKYWYQRVHASSGWESPQHICQKYKKFLLNFLNFWQKLSRFFGDCRNTCRRIKFASTMAKYNQPDPRNEDTMVWVNGLVPRKEASVSVLDSVVQGGDAVWEGLRIRQGRAFQLKEHVARLRSSAHALAFTEIPSAEEVYSAVFETLQANQMTDGVHARITLTRGKKSTSGMDPRLNVFGPTLIVLAEYKGLVYGDEGIALISSSVRRNSPSTWIQRFTTTICSTTYLLKSRQT